MPFSTTTVYTKEHMLDYQLYFVVHLVRTWVVLGFCTAASLIYLFLCVMSGFSEWLINLIAVALWALLLLSLFLYFVLPRIHINSAQALGAVVDYTFEEQSFTAHTKIEGHGEEQSTLLYSALQRACRTKDGMLYLFINKNAAYIVDTTAWADEQRAAVLHSLTLALGEERMR